MNSSAFLIMASIESMVAIAVFLLGLQALKSRKAKPVALNAKIQKAYPEKPLPFIVQTNPPSHE